MRILVISDVQDIDKIKLQLKDLCEYTSISIINTIDKASDFINNHIVKLQLPLDLIII